jgi:hypothetical protein
LLGINQIKEKKTMGISQGVMTALLKANLEQKCAICYDNVAPESDFKTNNIVVHRECIEEHCTMTTCFGCTIGKYPECAFLEMKTKLMDKGESESCTMLKQY